ncbi:MAG: DsrE/DsrF/DrsH-like family protein [Sulfolobales archaeon]
MPKISIIIASEKLDKVLPPMTLAVTAAVSGWESEVFFTFWGLLALKKGHNVGEVSSDYKAYERALKNAVNSGSIPNLLDLLRYGKSTGRMRIYACSTTMELLGMRRGDLIDYVDDVVGAAFFLNNAKNSDITLYIS